MRPRWMIVVAAVLAVGQVRGEEPASTAPLAEAADPPDRQRSRVIGPPAAASLAPESPRELAAHQPMVEPDIRIRRAGPDPRRREPGSARRGH